MMVAKVMLNSGYKLDSGLALAGRLGLLLAWID